MRSEERAGLISVILLILWGTLLTEPFHLFTGYLYSTLTSVEGVVNIKQGTPLFGFITSVVLALICIVLLLISKTNVAEYIPCVVFCLSGVKLFTKIISSRTFIVKDAVVVVIALSVIAILHAASLKKVLLWFADFVILSIPVYLFTGLVTKPVGALGKVVGKIFYINRIQEENIAACFKGLFGLPTLLWGVVLFILLILPIIYYTLSKRRS